MNEKHAPIAKITRPKITGIFPRERLFRLLDEAREHPVIWVSAPAGSGKTTLVASYLDANKIPCLWYQADEGDSDIATFFHYMGMAAKKAAPRKRKPLQLLTPEYAMGIPAFTRRFFEELFSRLGESVKRRYGNTKKPLADSSFFVVFDNYQDLPLNSGFHDMIIHGLDLIPQGIQIIILSRTEPPAAFARLRANDKISFVGWNELRLTPEESRAIFEMKAHGELTDEALLLLHEKTDGWAAGLILLLEGTVRRKTESQLIEGRRTQATRKEVESGFTGRFDELSHEAVFDYLAGEIFSKARSDVQSFMLRTAFLPEITVPMAEGLTGLSNSGKILSNLSLNNLFTERLSSLEPIYHYHPLLRAFLVSHAADYLGIEEVREVRQTAARLLEASGKTEEAAELFIEAGDWAGFGGVIQRNAQSLLSQGRIRTLEGWLLRIPQEVMGASPWFLYWLGTCRMPFNPVEGRQYFERAFFLFQKEDNPSGEFLAWSGAVDSFTYELSDFTPLDRWIGLFDELLDRRGGIPSLEIEARVASSMFHALIFRQPAHSRLIYWKERLSALLLRMDDIRQRLVIGTSLVHYCFWVGDCARAGWLIESLRPASPAQEISPLVKLMWQSLETSYLWQVGDFEGCLRITAKSLQMADKEGVHLLDLLLLSHAVYGALGAGDLTAGGELLRRMKSVMNPARRVFDVSHYHYLAGWEAFLRNDIAHAVEHTQHAVTLSKDTGAPFPQALAHIGMAHVLISRGEYVEAQSHIAEALRIGMGMNSMLLEYAGLFAKALLALEQGKESRCLTALRSAMELGKRQGFVNHPWWLPPVMARLCARALEAGIEVDYVQDLIRKRNLSPDVPPSDIENWPWPLRIYTLGQFEIVRDGAPVKFSGKVQRKVLAMLKALIGLGGRDVPADHLTDLLWPDADGDMAHISFKTTLHRLRQLIGNENIILLKEGRMTLDPRYCWADALTFEEILGKVEVLWDRNSNDDSLPRVLRLYEKAVGMYKGDFLAGETKEPWAVSMRERLKGKCLRLMDKVGQCYEQAGQWEKALECYQRAIEINDLQEEFYRRIMVCYQRLGRRAEALTIYNRCREVLSRVLGIDPSPETESLCKTLRAIQ